LKTSESVLARCLESACFCPGESVCRLQSPVRLSSLARVPRAVICCELSIISLGCVLLRVHASFGFPSFLMATVCDSFQLVSGHKFCNHPHSCVPILQCHRPLLLAIIGLASLLGCWEDVPAPETRDSVTVPTSRQQRVPMLLGELTRWATDILTPILTIIVNRFDLVSSSCHLSCLVFEVPVLPFFTPTLS